MRQIQAARSNNNKKIVWVVVGLITILFVARPMWRFATNQEPPHVHMLHGASVVCGVATWRFQVSSPWGLSGLSASVDGVPVMAQVKDALGKSCGVVEVSCDTTQFPDGMHTLSVQAVDGGLMGVATTHDVSFEIDNQPFDVAVAQDEIVLKQGQTVFLKVKASKPAVASATCLGMAFQGYADEAMPNEYLFIIPIDCECPVGSYEMVLDVRDHVGHIFSGSVPVQVTAGSFVKQQGFAVDREKLAQEKSVSTNDAVFEAQLETFYQHPTPEKLWHGSFEMPTVVQRITTPFGEIRVTKEKGRYLHKAIDIANTPKAVVWASQAGRVLLKDRFVMMGNTVVVDHGMGVISIYAHLDDFADITVGDLLKKGNPVGTVGRTGYASGYHLHWEMRMNNVAVDPLQWVVKI
jgi:murein DD-endopeptidase MepM/ murein hydrolase activator NlpD